jgi:hypothetical protein
MSNNLHLAHSIKKKATRKSKQDKKKGAGKGSNKGKSKNNSKRTHSGEWEWKNHIPSRYEPQAQEVQRQGLLLIYKAWMNHYPNECNEKELLEAQGGEGLNDNSNDNQCQRASYANGLNAIIMDIANSQE